MSEGLTIIRGDTVNFTTTFTNANGTPIDITGATVFFTVKANITPTDSTDATAIIKKTVTSHTNPTAGITTIALSPTDTAVTAGTYQYDIQLKTSGGAISSIQSGEFTVLQDVTQRTS